MSFDDVEVLLGVTIEGSFDAYCRCLQVDTTVQKAVLGRYVIIGEK